MNIANKIAKPVTKMYFWTKKKTHNSKTKQTDTQKKTLPEAGIEPGTSSTQSGCVTSAPPSPLRVTIVVKLFKFFDVMVRNVNKQSRICGPHIFNKVIFVCYFLNARITIFCSFSYLQELISLLKYGWKGRC